MSQGARTAAHVAVRAARAGHAPVGRYEVLAEIGSGGMASVQFGRLHAPHGFVRNVAIKRLHAQFAKDPDFVRMFIDEARLSARLAHANIVATLDIIDTPGELGLVMEYVHGESLWNLLRFADAAGVSVPVRVAAALAAAVLHGLQAAHEATDERGAPLGIVHRDVSPHNILVGSDGIVRLIDFGVAKAVGRLRATPSGEIKGKLLYMAPEQLGGSYVDHRADIYGAAAVLWETLTGVSPYDGSQNESALIHAVLLGRIELPSLQRAEVSSELDAIIMQGLARDPRARFATARDMALALERDVGIASQSELATWLHGLAGAQLAERARMIASVQSLQSPQSPSRSEEASAERGSFTPAAASALATAVIQQPDEQHLSRHTPPGPQRLEREQTTHRVLRVRPWITVVAAITTLALISVALWWRAHARFEARSRSNAPAVVLQAAQVAASEAATPHEPAAEPPAAAPKVAPPAAAVVSANATRAEPASKRAGAETDKRRTARPSRTEVTPKPPSQAQAQCKPWFYIDEAGIRRPKPGCL